MARIAAFSLIFLLAAAAAIASEAARPVGASAREHRFYCQGGEQVLVSERASSAAVRVGNSTYALRPRNSSLGRKFASPKATLIIDGSFAVFVAADRTNLRECYARSI